MNWPLKLCIDKRPLNHIWNLKWDTSRKVHKVRVASHLHISNQLTIKVLRNANINTSLCDPPAKRNYSPQIIMLACETFLCSKQCKYAAENCVSKSTNNKVSVRTRKWSRLQISASHLCNISLIRGLPYIQLRQI